jgi:hypothetical protein
VCCTATEAAAAAAAAATLQPACWQCCSTHILDGCGIYSCSP